MRIRFADITKSYFYTTLRDDLQRHSCYRLSLFPTANLPLYIAKQFPPDRRNVINRSAAALHLVSIVAQRKIVYGELRREAFPK